jgi:crotonobetaine/carnitine-CoA ligase
MTDPGTPRGLPPRDECVLPAMLDKRAAEIGDKTLVLFDPGGESWTYAETRRQARRAAAALHRLGVRRGDPVLVWLPSTAEILRLHLGLAYLGAVFVPINIALRGGTLAHIIENSGARLLICHSDLVDRLAGVALGALETLLEVGGESRPATQLRHLGEESLASADEAFPEPDPPVQPWEPHGIFYTSGTTGPSKGVLCPHVHTAVLGRTCLHFCDENDRFLINLPYFHLGGALLPFGIIGAGASMVLQQEYHTATFWDVVRRTGSTCCFLLGAVSTFLMKQPPRADDADNPLRVAMQQPLAHDFAEFSRRFGVTMYTQVDMTEMAAAILSGPVPNDTVLAHGYAGRARDIWPRYDVRLVDEFDCEVPPGVVGELVARCDVPWVISPGYHRNPEATAKAWRNGWFHTGDAFRRDDEGNFYFVDRMKDCIRRRGENISSAELEAEVLRYEAVADVAAVAAKSEFGEEEVLVAVAPKRGQHIDPEALTRFLIPRLPHFMVPRYVRVMDEMPYTETHKVQKSRLRAEGIAPGTWDREAAGITVKRERIGGPR